MKPVAFINTIYGHTAHHIKSLMMEIVIGPEILEIHSISR
jgi:hypothetical protein